LLKHQYLGGRMTIIDFESQNIDVLQLIYSDWSPADEWMTTN
jgi:hypothetical protein